MVLNPNGLVILGDKFAPWTWTARAGGDISGGQFLKIVSGTSLIASGADSYATNDIIAVPDASGADVIGIAMQNIASGTSNYVTFATKGLFIVTAGGAVDPTDLTRVEVYSDSVQPTVGANNTVGRAWTNAASGTTNCVILNLDI